MFFIVVICVLWLKMVMIYLRLNGFMYLDDEFNWLILLNFEFVLFNFVIN